MTDADLEAYEKEITADHQRTVLAYFRDTLFRWCYAGGIGKYYNDLYKYGIVCLYSALKALDSLCDKLTNMAGNKKFIVWGNINFTADANDFYLTTRIVDISKTAKDNYATITYFFPLVSPRDQSFVVPTINQDDIVNYTVNKICWAPNDSHERSLKALLNYLKDELDLS